MKGKIAILTTLVIILNCVFCYADNGETISVPNQVYTDLRNEFEYDEKTDTYYFPINNVDELEKEGAKSATVAVSGAVISSVLALAVKAGLEFATTNSMSEFVSRFFMLDGISSVVDGISGAIKGGASGVINFSRSLLDTIGSKFSELMSKKDVTSIYLQGRRYPVIKHSKEGNGDISDTLARYLFETTTLPKISFDASEISKSNTDYYYDSDIFLPSSSAIGTMSVRVEKYRSSTPYSDDIQIRIKDSSGSYKTVYSQYTTIEFPSGTFNNGFRVYTIPYLSETDDRFYVGQVTAVYSTISGFLSTIKGNTTYGSIPRAHLATSSPLPVIGEAWTDGTIPSVDNGSLDIGIPKDTNQLVNKKPSDVVSTPSYEIWTPGTTVIPPSIDTGTSNPPVDDVLPPITEDVPDDDTGTDAPSNPGSPSISWDWLKNLLNKLLEMIQTIIDWLTSFWDKLLEFIQGLVVPGEDYFVEEFGKITEKLEEKVPSVDIAKLESLAVEETQFKDIYAEFFGVRCLVVRGSLINNVIGWAKPIIQGLIALFLLLYNYNQIYFLIRGTSLLGASNTINNMDNNRIGGRR